MPESFSRNNVQKNSTSFSLVKDFLADLCTMRMHSETCWRTNPTKPTVRESLPQRVQCLIWNSDAMCIPDAASTMFRKVNVFFSQLRRSFNFLKFTSNETPSLNMSASGHLSPSWRLLQPTTCITREMLQGFSRFVAHLRFLNEFLHLLY